MILKLLKFQTKHDQLQIKTRIDMQIQNLFSSKRVKSLCVFSFVSAEMIP